jgi:hypothetical protein
LLDSAGLLRLIRPAMLLASMCSERLEIEMECHAIEVIQVGARRECRKGINVMQMKHALDLPNNAKNEI